MLMNSSNPTLCACAKRYDSVVATYCALGSKTFSAKPSIQEAVSPYSLTRGYDGKSHPDGIRIVNVLDRMVLCDGCNLTANVTFEFGFTGF